MKTTITFCLLLFVFASCRKRHENAYSIWIINKDTFSTNDVRLDIGKAIAIFSTNNFENGFGFMFYTYSANGLPSSGTFLITDTTSQNPNYVELGFYYNGHGYTIAEDLSASIVAMEKNGKASCVLSPTWFTNPTNSVDSVLIQGTFNEP